MDDAVVFDETGRIYVADIMAHEIVVLDPDGSPVAPTLASLAFTIRLYYHMVE